MPPWELRSERETKRRADDRRFYIAVAIGGAVLFATGAGLVVVSRAFWTQPAPLVIYITGPK